MSSITENLNTYYDNTKEKLAEYYDKTKQFLSDNMLVSGIILAIIIIVMLNLLFPNRVLQVLINNINNIVILGILSLLIYILIFFLDKDKEYKDLRKFVEDRKVKLDNLMDTVNTKNTDIVNNHTSMQNEINNIGTSNVVGTSGSS
tara:strand:- start:459 stop:896 length:438 start_codon:yes stop_codon:yes gene_type:complete